MVCGGCTLHAADHLFGNNGLSFADPVGVLYHLQISPNDQHSPVIKIGKLV